MRAIYIGGGSGPKRSKTRWKLYLYLALFLTVVGGVLKITAPTIVEQWINRQGSGSHGYAFSIRDVDFSFAKGLMVLKDVKVFNPKTTSELLEASELKISLNLADLVLSDDKKVSVDADSVDLILSKDLSSEIERIHASKDKKHLYLSSLTGKIGQLNILEQKDDQSRTVLELKDVNVQVKDVSANSINKKTRFNVTSKVADGGKLDITGKTSEENGKTPWSIRGSLKQVPSGIFNKISGDKIPFSFTEASLNAEISAHSENGKVTGEILPDIRKVNLLEERPGIPAQSIARLLNDELTFSLPFTLKDELTLEYEDTYRKLKTYRRSPATSEVPAAASAAQPAGDKKPFKLWPF